MPNLTNSFHTHLEARTAVNDELKRSAYRLRYNVYCVERGYEDESDFPDKMEMDEFDSESVHAVVRHKSSNCPVGVVRLVLPNQKRPERQFPIETHFGHRFEKPTLNKFNFSRHNIAEVSRFAVSKQSLVQIQRRLAEEIHHEDPNLRRRDPTQLLPQISLGLIAMLFVISKQHGIGYWYAAMEPSLSRLLTRLGIEFSSIGPVMNYHGKRQPMIAKVDDLLENIQRSRRDFFTLITNIGGVPDLDHQAAEEVSGARLYGANRY